MHCSRSKIRRVPLISGEGRLLTKLPLVPGCGRVPGALDVLWGSVLGEGTLRQIPCAGQDNFSSPAAALNF